jgi:hypothetical protein
VLVESALHTMLQTMLQRVAPGLYCCSLKAQDKDQDRVIVDVGDADEGSPILMCGAIIACGHAAGTAVMPCRARNIHLAMQQYSGHLA